MMIIDDDDNDGDDGDGNGNDDEGEEEEEEDRYYQPFYKITMILDIEMQYKV